MARILFIRVSAATYDEKEVLAAWPMLYAAVWPDPAADGADSPRKIVRAYLPAPERGVLELAGAFVDYARFTAPKEHKDSLQGPADQLEALLRQLDDALGDRDVHKAQELAGKMEAALDEAEKILRAL